MVNLRKRQLRRSAGFSLIELLIVVAIIAALVGVAVPMFQKNIAEAHKAKANEDLDTIRNSITLHDSQNKPLIGTDLKPLLGRYLQELPKDPWGNDYLLDAGMGVVISFGGDQKAGGTDEDEDLMVRYKSVLKIQKVVYTGSWGLPLQGNEFRIQFNKTYQVKGGADPLKSVLLVLDNKTCAAIPFSGGSVSQDYMKGTTTPPPLAAGVSSMSWGGTTWGQGSSDPANGLLVIKCTAAQDPNAAGTDKIRINPAYSINIPFSVMATGTTSSGSIQSSCDIAEQYTKGGPCDPSAFGTGVLNMEGAHPQEMIGGENRGVPIERSR